MYLTLYISSDCKTRIICDFLFFFYPTAKLSNFLLFNMARILKDKDNIGVYFHRKRTCNIKRQNGIATNTKQMEEVQAAIERISNSNSDTENQDNISDEGTNATAVDIQSLQKKLSELKEGIAKLEKKEVYPEGEVNANYIPCPCALSAKFDNVTHSFVITECVLMHRNENHDHEGTRKTPITQSKISMVNMGDLVTAAGDQPRSLLESLKKKKKRKVRDPFLKFQKEWLLV